jgi:putative ABC transport system permease protein
VLKHYVRVALRNVRSAPFAFAMNVLTLALGLACFVTVYAFVTFWQSAEQHFANANRIAVVTTSFTLADNSFSFKNDPRVTEYAAKYLRADFPAVEKVARAVVMDEKSMVAAGDRALRSYAAAVDPEFLEIFDLPFIAGDARTALSAPGSVVVTKEQATKLFGDPNALGRHVLVGNLVDATVTGVIDAIPEPSHMGRSTAASLKFDLLATFDIHDAIRARNLPPGASPPGENWISSSAITYLLLPADGSFTIDALRAQLPEFVRRHVPPELAGFATLEYGALPVHELLSNSIDVGLFIDSVGMTVPAMLLTLGTLVLAVACLNYANLATARAARRTREVGLRKALGARRAQIAAQYLLEAALLTAVALLAAFAMVWAALPLLAVLAGADLGPTLFAGARFWAFAAAVIAGVTLAAGAYPALALAHVRPVGALHSSRGQLGSKWLSTLLIGTQFAVASFLLIAVAVTVQQNAHLKRTGLGLDSDPLVLIQNESGTTKVEAATLRQELVRVPQVKGVTEIDAPPWVNLSAGPISRSPDQNAPARIVIGHGVGLDFFAVFDIDVLAGRVFAREYGDDLRVAPKAEAAGSAPPPASSEPDAAPEPPQLIVVDRAFVETFGFASPEEAVNQLVYTPQLQPAASGGKGAQASQIVGVVENRTFSFFGGFGTAGTAYRLQPRFDYQVVRVSRDDVAGGLAGIDRTWRELAPNVAIVRRFLDDFFNEVYETFLRVGQVVTGLALLAFLISVTGLFGMATLIASRRRREVGVRKAHGATSSRMIAMLLVSFSKPVVVANLIVWPFAYFAARAYLDNFESPIALTPWPFVLSLAVTLLISWLAVGSQTLQAARARPAEVLHYE